MDCRKIRSSFSFNKKYMALFLFIIILVFLIVLELWFMDFLSKGEGNNISKFYAACMIVLTTVLVFIAWDKLSSLNKTSRAEFLLRVDERYSSSEIIQARAIIQKFYCVAREVSNDREKYIPVIQEKIKKLGQSGDCATEFTLLLNFLDFLETVAYFAKKDFVQGKDIDELLGGSIEYYFDVFKAWIDYRRSKYNDTRYYCELESFIQKVRDRKK